MFSRKKPEEPTTIETYVALEERVRGALISSYIRYYDHEMEPGMWYGKFNQYATSVNRAAFAKGISDFDSLRNALRLEFILTAINDETLPNHVRNGLRAAARIPFGFCEEAGLAQSETYMWTHEYMREHLSRMLDHMEKGYAGAAFDMKRGMFDWPRAV